jgi:hypothetical protein
MTAEEFIRVYLEKQIMDNNDDVYASIDGVSDVMRMFASYHVKSALTSAAIEAELTCDGKINKAPILNAYDLKYIT